MVATHLVCRLQLPRLRAWKRRSLTAGVCVDDIIRPQAYSSSSTAFRGFLKEAIEQKRDAVLWIVTSHAVSGRSRKRASLAAEIRVRKVYKGDEDMPELMRRYVWSWSEAESFEEGDCWVAEADPEAGRFYPSNDIGPRLEELRYVNRDGSCTEYSPRRVMRVHPKDVAKLKRFAANIERDTVFLSYKHADFEEESAASRPSWQPTALAESLIGHGLGVWMDSLCAPRQVDLDEDANLGRTLTKNEVQLLLAEGLRQSGVVLAVDSARYGTEGEDGVKWTLNEYRGRVGKAPRTAPLRRFALHGAQKSKLRPPPNDQMPWSEAVDSKLTRRLRKLLAT